MRDDSLIILIQSWVPCGGPIWIKVVEDENFLTSNAILAGSLLKIHIAMSIVK